MKRRDLPYLKVWRDRHGKRRIQFRRAGKQVSLPGDPGSPEFLAAYQAAMAEYERGGSNQQAVPGTFNSLIIDYYRSPSFTGLRPSTQTQYRREMERWRGEHGNKRVAHLQRKHIREQMAERAKAGGPEAGNNLLRVVRILCAFAVDCELRVDNPATAMRKFKMRSDGFVAWSEADIAQYLERWGAGSVQRLALILLLYTGQRRSDVIVMGRQHVRGDTIRVRQSKTGAHLIIPMHPVLKGVLDALPATGLAFLTTQYGRPFKNSAAFGNRFREWCDAANLQGRSAHGLRKSAAVRLVEAGCSSKEVAAITGHASLREIERYTRAAEQEKLARAAIARLIENG